MVTGTGGGLVDDGFAVEDILQAAGFVVVVRGLAMVLLRGMKRTVCDL